ncbi:hypothetical protein L210DRAFT_3643428 [Boletus edulis BED1]|uniref:Zn(2)-C6 fungal-type domain-containing protein n=1 Tax=Boletus edulis BED1 TaxID=1328754 RepID=A0AAD4BZ94_BOLED|nr:hypothetical protein L210DRAFT_3643428 [Boletus edulis BED1]
MSPRKRKKTNLSPMVEAVERAAAKKGKRACTNCHARKTACVTVEGSALCNLCIKKSLPCVFEDSSDLGTRSRSQSAPPAPSGSSHAKSRHTGTTRKATGSRALQSKPQATTVASTSQVGKRKAAPAATESIQQPMLKRQRHSPSEEESWIHPSPLSVLEAVPELDEPDDDNFTSYWQVPDSSHLPDTTEVLSIVTGKQVDVITSDNNTEVYEDEAACPDEGETF